MKTLSTRSRSKPSTTLTVVLGFAAFCIAFVIVSIWQGNEYNVYPLSRLKWVAVIAIALFGIAYFLAWTQFQKIGRAISQAELRRQAAIGLLFGLVASWFWPAAVPVVPLPGSLQIQALGQENQAASGANVEIRKVTNLDGSPIGLERFQLDGDWRIQNGHLVSEGGVPGASADYNGLIAGGIILDLRYNLDGGQALVTLNGASTQLDLYSDTGLAFPQAFGKAVWQNAGWQQKLVTALAFVFQILGIAFLVLLLWVVGRVYGRFLTLILILIYAIIFANYLNLKLDYAQFNAGRAFRDTTTYVATAEQPITSSNFWIGERTFTVPLAYKILHVNSANFTLVDRLRGVDAFQTCLSILSWTALALAVALSLRRPWSGLLAFGLVLYFSLNLEVSLWDSLLLSESISFSLLALLLAAWIGMGLLPSKWQTNILGWIYLAGVIVITILYSFTRDTNLYLVAAAAGVLLLLSLLRRDSLAIPRKYVYTYVAFAAVLFIFQTTTVQAGGRWEIHIYDHLALRVLPNLEARQYYIDAGLPVTPDLMAITEMPGYEYQDYLEFDPRMAPVRAWIQERGRSTFLNYLLAHPSQTFLDPVRQASALLNGSNLEYRYPRYAMQSVPERITQLSNQYYPHQPLILWLVGGLILASLFLDWRIFKIHQPLWWVLAAVAISIYPLMMVVWNGNPMEIERHAAQIGNQYRLAGLFAVLLLLEWVQQALIPYEEYI